MRPRSLPVASAEPNMHSSGGVIHVSRDYTGAGMLVGILDTGLDVDHEAFLQRRLRCRP